MTRRVVFVIGLGHSGSTLLSLLLGSHSRAFALGEFASLWRLLSANSSSVKVCGVCVDDCEFWDDKTRRRVLADYFRRRRGRFEPYLYWQVGSFRRDIYRHLFQWAAGAEILVDSSKSPGWMRRQLRPWWFWRDIDARLLYLSRDGRAVVNSVLRKYPERDVAEASRSWLRRLENRESWFASFPPARRLRVSYEELTTGPERVMRQICEWLGLGYEPEMLNYWKHKHHLLGGNLGARSSIFLQRRKSQPDLLKHYQEKNLREGLTDLSFYEELGLAIKPDLRWKTELGAEQLAVFERIGGEANRRYCLREQS